MKSIPSNTAMNALFEPKIIDPDFPIKIREMNGAHSFLYHWHESVEILYGLERSTGVGILDQPYVLNEQDIIIIGPGESHCLFPSDYRARRLAVVFDPSFIFSMNAFREHKQCFSQIKRHSGEWPEEVRSAIKNSLSGIYEEFTCKNNGWREAAMSHLLNIIVTVLRGLPREEREYHREYESMLRKVLQYLSEEYLNDISLKSCAEALGFNSSYLSSQFKRKTGVTFHQYLSNIRLNKAEWLLANSAVPISLVPEQVGFSSVKTFYRVFLEKYGVSPGRYRKEKQK